MITLTITLTQDELQALGALLDAAVKATGIQGAILEVTQVQQ